MNEGSPRLICMTTITPRTPLDDLPASVHSPGGTRLQRRAVLDLSIDEELVRGDRRGVELSQALSSLLAVIVNHVLESGTALSERALLDGVRSRRPFAAGRNRNRLESLIGMNLVRRDGADVHATVAGISAILRPSLLDGPRPPRTLLRLLRQAELDSAHG